MSIVSFAENDQFIFRVRQHWEGNPERYFWNTYEAYAVAAGNLNALMALGRALVAFQQDLQYDQIIYDSWAVGTWEPDSHPYDPSTFYTEVLTATHGAISSAGAQMEDKDMVLWLARQPIAGNLGRIFLRGALSEGDIQNVAGALTLFAPDAIQTRLTTAKAHIADYLFINVPEFLTLAMSGVNEANIDYIRPIYNIGLRGVTRCKANHRYFDVPAREGPAPDPSTPEVMDPGTSTYEERVPDWGGG